MTAIITPFRDDGEVDHEALAGLVRWQVDQGIDGLVPAGTTGEGATLADTEHQAVVRTVVEAAEGRAPVAAATIPFARWMRPGGWKRQEPTACWWSRPITTSRTGQA